MKQRIGKSGPRLVFKPHESNGKLRENLNYDLVLKPARIRISALWDGRQFIVTHSSTVLAARLKDQLTDGDVIECEINQPTGYKQPDGLIGTCPLTCAGTWGTAFLPYIQMQLDPRRFQCIVPAKDGLEMATLLEKRFADAMGVVRNRLGLHISIVYFDSAVPLRAALDAARRAQDVPRQLSPRRIDWISQEQTFDEISAESTPIKTTLQFDDEATWLIPTAFPIASVFGDKCAERSITPDNYFPYFMTVDGRMLHASQLSAGDSIQNEVSTFDYEFMDSASRRFEVAYESATGRRRALSDPVEDRSHRPHPIEYVHDLRSIANLLKEKISVRQMKILDGLLTAKQAEWGVLRSQLDPAFVRAVIANLETLTPDGLTKDEKERLERAQTRGVLHDAIEIYLGIEKAGGQDQ